MPLSGLLNLDKPYGVTSSKIIYDIKRRFRLKKIGYAGTLDPLATGVLMICIGKATRLVPFLVDCRKRYSALIRLGVATKTQDREGKLSGVYTLNRFPSQESVLDVVNSFKGEIEQVPPMYSALRYKGKRLYELARNGKEVPRKSRIVKIYELVCCGYSYPFIHLDIICSKGTYIRTLAEDIGFRLGTGGHIWALKRTGVGGYNIENALSCADLMAMNREELEDHLIPIGEILSFFPSVKLATGQRESMLHGQSFSVTSSQYWKDLIPEQGMPIIRVYDKGGEFLGLGLMQCIVTTDREKEIYLKPSLVLAKNPPG